MKLANPDGLWASYAVEASSSSNDVFQDEGVYTSPSNLANIEKVPDSPGYNRLNNIDDPDANSIGFNAMPKGYFKERGKVHFYFNGCLVLWTSVGSSATGAARCVKIASDNTGILHQSWGATAKEGYAVRCVKDAE